MASWPSAKAPWQFYYKDPKEILLFFHVNQLHIFQSELLGITGLASLSSRPFRVICAGDWRHFSCLTAVLQSIMMAEIN